MISKTLKDSGLQNHPAGSFLEVILRAEIELNDNNDPTGNINYYVVEVNKVIPPVEQTNLFKQ